MGFDYHISKTLDESFIFSNFTDVTLVSDDDKHFSAHKIVLCASSLILNEILQTHPHQDAFIYFKSVKPQELKAMLDYLYLGSV